MTLTPSAQRVLAAIYALRAGMTQAQIAAHAGLSAGMVNGLLSRLQAEGYCRKERRKHGTIEITDAGRMRVERLTGVSAGGENAEGTR
jgi:DNA-binding MarR family transcriptional regulator